MRLQGGSLAGVSRGMQELSRIEIVHLLNVCYGPIISRLGTFHFCISFLPFNGLVSEALLLYFTYSESYQFKSIKHSQGAGTEVNGYLENGYASRLNKTSK